MLRNVNAGSHPPDEALSHSNQVVLAALAAAVVVHLVSGLVVRRLARGRYRWLLEPLRLACRRPLGSPAPAASTSPDQRKRLAPPQT